MKWIGQHIWDLTSRFRGISIFEKAIKLLKSDGGDGGVISMTGNDMVLSNAAGDVLIGSTTYQVGGDQDIFIGDGINSVDLVFEQSGAIKGYDSSVNLTIGGGGGTITFADKVNFVGGGIENEFQFNNLTIDGNFELSPITTTTSGGVLNGGFLNPAAEAKQVHMPQVLNDLAGFNHWGTVTVTGLYKTRTGSPGSYAYSNPVLPSDFASAFDGTSSTAGSWYSDNGASGTVQGEGVITLEWTNEALYGLWFGLVFGSDSFVPSRIKMEAYQTDVGWRTFADLTGVSSADIGNIILRQIDGNSGTGQATSKLRFTLGSSISGSYLYFRIHTIYLANYAQGNNNLSGLGTDLTRGYHYLERYRPNYAWGHFSPGQTTTYNLGGSSYRWAIGYFNSLDVAQSLNIAGSISAGSSVGNLNVSAGIGQDLEYGSTVVTTLRFDSDRWRLYAGGTSSEVATITEGGNFGIGTTSPGFKLDVKTSSSDDGISLSATSGRKAIEMLIDNGTNGGGDIKMYTGTSVLTNRINAQGSSYINGGNVGIGHSSPVSNLHIYENSVDTNSAAGLTIEQAGTGDALAQFLLSGQRRWVVGADNSDADKFKIASSIDLASDAYLTIDTAGKVGIGTTNPSSRLDVNGIGTFNQVRIGDSTTTNYGLIVNYADTRLLQLKRGGNTAFRVIADSSDGQVDIYDNSGNSDIRLHADNDSYITNNLGIGTTSPSYKLDVNGTSRVAGTIHMYGSVRNYSGDFSLHNAHQDSDILFKVNGGGTTTTAMMIDGATSNVGIGTASPSEKLEVNGKIKATDINFSGLPTSSVGLSSGDVWNDGGTLKIVS